MKRLSILSLLLSLSVMALNAQRIQVVDSAGLPIPFAVATTASGKYITSTDADGWLYDIGENSTLNISQVAYKPLTIATADIKEGKIQLLMTF